MNKMFFETNKNFVVIHGKGEFFIKKKKPLPPGGREKTFFCEKNFLKTRVGGF